MDLHSVVALRLGPTLGVLVCCYSVYVGDVLDLLVVVATNCNNLYVLEPSHCACSGLTVLGSVMYHVIMYPW